MPIRMEFDPPEKWQATRAMLAGLPTRTVKAFDDALREEAEFLREKAAEILASPNIEPLSPITQAFGASGPALSGLAQHVIVRRVDGGYFVGIPAGSARTRSGRDAADVAAIHAAGAEYTVEMTDRQRRWLFSRLREAGVPPAEGANPGFITIRLPPRPFLDLLIEQWGDTIRERVIERVADSMGGDLGDGQGDADGDATE